MFSVPRKTVALADLTVAQGEKLAWGKRTYVMGVINLTPDSFSRDGPALDVQAAVDLGLRFEAEGADFLDLGAESTRPGAAPVAAEEELARLLPTLRALTPKVRIPISVDTYKARVARTAVEHGASLINDIWGLKAEPELAHVAAETGAGLIIMHNQLGHHYHDLLPDIFASLCRSMTLAQKAGVPGASIILDPGIGFGKTPEHNLEVLRRLKEFRKLGYPLLVGPSRKSTIGLVLDLPSDQRVEGTSAAVALAIGNGADMVRVHDVKEMVRVCRMSDAIVRGWRPKSWRP